MHKSTKATTIPVKVKQAVLERDGGVCILCGKRGDPVAHYISRAQLGIGQEENIVTLCPECHRAYDGVHRKALKPRIGAYLKARYDDWDESKLVYGRNK